MRDAWCIMLRITFIICCAVGAVSGLRLNTMTKNKCLLFACRFCKIWRYMEILFAKHLFLFRHLFYTERHCAGRSLLLCFWRILFVYPVSFTQSLFVLSICERINFFPYYSLHKMYTFFFNLFIPLKKVRICFYNELSNFYNDYLLITKKKSKWNKVLPFAISCSKKFPTQSNGKNFCESTNNYNST